MHIRKLRKLDADCAGVTIPKDDLRFEGYVDENGELVEQPALTIEREGEGTWRIQVLDENLVPVSE